MSNPLQVVSTSTLLRSLLVADDIIYKAAGKESQVYLSWEKRLARIFTNSYHRLGRKAIDKVLRYLEKQPRFTNKTLTEIDHLITREFNEWANDKDTFKSIHGVLDEAYRKSLKMSVERVLGLRGKLPLHTIDPDRTVGHPVTKRVDSEGIYLVAPHGAMVASGDKTLMVKARHFNIGGQEFYLLSEDKVFGVVRFGNPKEINLAEFKALSAKHLITEEERKKWWLKVKNFWAYEVESFEPLPSPKPFTIPAGVQTFVQEVDVEGLPALDEVARYLGVTKAEVEGLGEISLVDEGAIEALADQQAFWMGDFYPGEFQQGLKDNARELLIESGLDKQEAAKAFHGYLRSQFGFVPEIPAGWKGHPDDYFRNLAGNVVTVARAHGTLRGFDRLGVSKYTISNPEDEATCPICSRMADTTFSVSQAIERMDRQIKAKSKEAVQKIHPWLSWKKIQAIPADKLLGEGVGYPPFHYGCRCSIELADDWAIEPGEIEPAVEPVERGPREIGPPNFEDLEWIDLGETHGIFDKTHYKDREGNVWMFKPDPSGGRRRYVTEAEVAAGKLARFLGHPAAEIHKYNIRGVGGSMQLHYKNVLRKDLTREHRMVPQRFPYTKVQTEQIQREHLFDFFINNKDTHYENVMLTRGRGKNLRFIDKGLALAGLPIPSQPLRGWASLPDLNVAARVWVAHENNWPGASGKLAKYSKVKDLVETIENMPNEQFLGIMNDWMDEYSAYHGISKEVIANELLEHKRTYGERVRSFYSNMGLLDA